MSEAARILLEILTLGRTKSALFARAAFAEQRGLDLNAKTKRFRGNRAKRIARRAEWWHDHAITLRERALRQ